MGKHTPLPSDPEAKAAEKRRRFNLYRSEWKKRKRAELRARKIQAKQDLLRAAKVLGLDLCLDIRRMHDSEVRWYIKKHTKL
jgi:hypothetical protein